MSYGDHWSEPARCGRCGQDRGTHDDGECAGVARAMSEAAKTMPIRPGSDQIAERLYTLSVKCRAPLTTEGWQWVTETLEGIQEMVALEAWKIEHQKAEGK